MTAILLVVGAAVALPVLLRLLSVLDDWAYRRWPQVRR